MFYQEGFADEDALNAAILQLVGETDELCQDIERLQESWQGTFASPPLVNPANQASGHYGNFIWEALTTAVDHDDILPFLADVFEESRAQSEEISEQDVGRAAVAPILEEAAGDEPTDQGNEAQLGLEPEEGASSNNDGFAPGQFDDYLQRAIHRLHNRLLNEKGTGDWFSPSNPSSVELLKETLPENEGAASSINADNTTPTCELPSMPLCRTIRGARSYIFAKRNSMRIRQKGTAERNEDPQSEGASSVNAVRVNERPEAPHLSDKDVAGNRRQTPNEGSPHNSDVDQNIAGLWTELPEPPSAFVETTTSCSIPHTPSYQPRMGQGLIKRPEPPSAFVETPTSSFSPRTPNQPRPVLRRSISTPQLQEISENSSLPVESLQKDVSRRQSLIQMRPWLESNASALIGTSNIARSYSPNFTQPIILEKSDYMQTLFCEQINSICEDIKEIRDFALRKNIAANKYLVDALRCLTTAKSEIRKEDFRASEDDDFANLTLESNQHAQKDLRNIVIVTGVPKVANENVLEIVKRIGYCMGSPIDDMYIKDAFRLNKSDPSSPILVIFKNLVVKEMLINASNRSVIYANQIGIRVGGRSLISVQDQLTFKFPTNND